MAHRLIILVSALAGVLAAPGLGVAQTSTAAGGEVIEVVSLNYADVSEVAGLVSDAPPIRSNDVFTPHEPAFGSQGAGQTNVMTMMTPGPPPQSEPGADSLGQTLGPHAVVDRRLNAIILRGTREEVDALRRRIEAVDRPVDSVVLETTFVELDEAGARSVGIDFSNTSGQIGVVSVTAGDASRPSGGYGASEWRQGRAQTSYALQAAISAQITSGHGRIVSRPRISAASGATAKIITGDAIPIMTAIAMSGINAVSQQVQYVNVGVTLQIAPRIAADGYVTSHVFCVVSNVTGAVQGVPTISQREAQTSATVRDGEAFIIGGLTQESDMAARQSIPGLSRTPLVGGVFGLRQANRTKTDLYIVVTPRIIRHGQASPPPAMVGG